MDLPKRKLPRLPGYDYSTPGAYFITICTHKKRCIFGKIISTSQVGDAEMVYSPIGVTAKKCLTEIPQHFPGVTVDNWVIMPNHIHILLRIHSQTERIYPLPTNDISNIIGAFKGAVTRAVGNTQKIWQTSFYDHIIRNENDYQNIWQYICGNPSKWADDCFYIDSPP